MIDIYISNRSRAINLSFIDFFLPKNNKVFTYELMLIVNCHQ